MIKYETFVHALYCNEDVFFEVYRLKFRVTLSTFNDLNFAATSTYTINSNNKGFKSEDDDAFFKSLLFFFNTKTDLEYNFYMLLDSNKPSSLHKHLSLDFRF